MKIIVYVPPARQSSVAGHGNEYQIFRDYLAFSIAIYDEVPSWYEYVGGRVYNDFLPVREYYFQSGMTFQGTGYAITRNVPMIYSAWLLKVATGDNPYGSALQDAMWGLFNYEVAPGLTFTDGDASNHVDIYPEYENRHHAYMIAYLYGDAEVEIDNLSNANGVEGGIFGNVAAIFATSRTKATTALSATVSGSGSVNYYVSGVAAGTWNVTVNGQSQGNYTATAEGGLLTFTAPAGSVVITPVN